MIISTRTKPTLVSGHPIWKLDQYVSESTIPCISFYTFSFDVQWEINFQKAQQ